MQIEPFLMERWQSTWEHKVAYNLSESGVHPLTLGELLSMPGGDEAMGMEALTPTLLGYAQGNGREDLRERVAAIYPGSSIQQVLITHGGAEANYLTTLRLIEKGDEVVMLLPNYMQTHGLVRAWGADLKPWYLREELDWLPDPDELKTLVGGKTKLIVITNPNNPTGRVLGEEFIQAVSEAADRVGAWILADEIYRGAELRGPETASFWGRGPRVIITSGLSKAYGLPGLRIGWAVTADRAMADALWSYHDYSTICPSPLTERLALHALEPERRQNILGRTRSALRSNLPLLLEWVEAQGDLFHYVPPDAGAILWLRYELPIPSGDLAERLRAEEDTLIVPGQQFGMDRYLRLGYGPEPDYLVEGLERLRRVLESCRVGTGA